MVTANPHRSGKGFVIQARAAASSLPTRVSSFLGCVRDHNGPAALLPRELPVPSSLPPTPSCLMTGLAMDSMRAEGVLAVLASCAGQPLGFREWDSRHVVQNRYPVPAHEKIQTASGAAEHVIRTEASFADISPDFLALMCLRADPGGVARTTVADIGETIGDLSARASEYLAQPWYAFETDNYDCVIDGRALTKPVPVLRERNGRPPASSEGSGQLQGELRELPGVHRVARGGLPGQVRHRVALHGSITTEKLELERHCRIARALRSVGYTERIYVSQVIPPGIRNDQAKRVGSSTRRLH
jgi:hypothetical protein